MNFDEYERSGMALYEGLSEIVASILRAAIHQHGGLHPQQIQHRADGSKGPPALGLSGAQSNEPIRKRWKFPDDFPVSRETPPDLWTTETTATGW